MFSKEFEIVHTNKIVESLRSDGFFAMENALSKDFILNIRNDVANCGYGVNKNWVGGVYVNNQYYLTHMLAASKVYYDYCTAPKIMDICAAVLGNEFRLKALRYYETYSGSQQVWHTDNKTDRTFAHIPGIILIAYVSDVIDGEFQYVRGSQAWSGQQAYNDYSDEFINEKYGKDVVSFKMPSGSLIIYDTYGIHRAKPVSKRGFVRQSLFLQVDSEVKSAEPLLVNPKFIDRIDDRLKQYLGFGLPSEYSVFPATDEKTLPLISPIGLKLLRWPLYRAIRRAYEAAPMSIKRAIKKMIKH